MKKYLFLSSIPIMILTTLGGCSISDDYCCTNNDQCVTVNDKDTFCTIKECGKCEAPEQPLQISVTDWKNPSVGEPYEVELTASGGFSPYDWVELSKVNDTENKLAWLVLEKVQNDPSKAYLRNGNNNNQPLLPSNPTTLSDTLTIKVTVVDNTRHVTDVNKVDKSIVVFSHDIKINDCPHKCKRTNDSNDNPTANVNDTECKNNMLYTCIPSFTAGNCVKWDDGKSCPSNCKNDNVSCCTGDLCPQENDSKCEVSVTGGNAQVFNCKRDSFNCLIWDSTSINPCPKNICVGKSCGDCSAICTPPASDCADTKTKKICGSDQNGCPIWTNIPCEGNKTCTTGTCKYFVGDTGPGGGIVFYDNPNYVADGWQYLEAAPNDQSTSSGAPWGCSGLNIMDCYATNIGAGKNNTTNIATQCTETSIAAKLCYNQNLGNGYTDWFLPSFSELLQLCNERARFNNFSEEFYWSSSSRSDLTTADYVLFKTSCMTDYDSKTIPHLVRCVRRAP